MQVILHDEKVSGLTLHLMDRNFDSGAILAQKEIPIKSADTSKELRERTIAEVRDFISKFITNLSKTNNIVPKPQNEKEATYFHNITGEERMINFRKQGSEEIYRTVRALHPFLPCYITYKGKFFVVNPYKMCFWQGYMNDYVPGDLIDKNPKFNSLTFVCADKKAIEFMELKLYHASLLTSYYIQNYVKCTVV
jgi:methionyl-tRNA formyltransferase